MNNLNYELCKQLKDAGFTQEEGDGYTHSYNERAIPISKIDLEKLKDGRIKMLQITDVDTVYVPTLSELIEACNKLRLDQTYFTLTFEKDINDKKNDEWLAGFQVFYDCHPSWEPVAYGSTAEEAVANLWLDLNKKV